MRGNSWGKVAVTCHDGEVAQALMAPGLWGSVWLLVYGLDELGALAREELLAQLRAWPGSVVVTTRHLANTPPDFAACEVDELDRGRVEALLKLEGREECHRPGYLIASRTAELIVSRSAELIVSRSAELIAGLE